MISKRFSEITVNDIHSLIDNSVSEGKTIEFKQTYSLISDAQKGEFLADVSSLANTSGGDLIFGVREEDAIARELTPFTVKDTDGETLKMENLLRNGISPRLKVDIRFIAAGVSDYFLILRMPKSWSSPHRVIFTSCSKTKDQFYARDSKGKYQLDVGELRTAFNLAETLVDKIKNFRMQRTSAIIAEETPIPLATGGKVILHIVPLKSFSQTADLDIKKLKDVLPQKLHPMFKNAGWGSRLNFDGYITFGSITE